VAESDPVAGTIPRIAPLFAAHAVGSANITLVVALSPSIEESLGLGHAGFGLMISVYYGAMLVLALPAGWLADRFGLRAMLVIAHVLLAIGLLVLASARGLPTGALALVLCGSGYALINPATARGVLMWFPRSARATAMGVKQTGVPAGGVVAALIAATGHADWRALATGMAVVTMIAGAGYLALRVAPQPALSVARFGDIRELLRLPRLALFNVAACLYAAGQAAFFAYLVLYARDAMAAPLALASLCLGIAHAASATGRICWGMISDRLVRNGRIVCLVAIGLSATIGVMLLMGLPALGTTALIGTAALIGFTLGGYAGLIQAAAVEAVKPHRAGAAIGYNMLLISFGTMLGPAAFGIGVEWIGYTAAWSAVAALLLVGAALFRTSTATAAR
jgi:predicted MFS family arabinose efflux permease